MKLSVNTLLSNKFKWNTAHLNQIKLVLEQLLALRDRGGAFFLTSEKKEKSVYCTIECLFPFLLYPFSQEYSDTIDSSTRYIIKNTNIEEGVPTDSQFPVQSIFTIDTTAFGVYVLTLARNYYLETTLGYKNALLINIEKRIRSWIKFISNNKNNSGWALIKGNESRVYSTSLVIGAISNCEDSDFEAISDRTQLLTHGIDYILSKQESGGWGCLDENNKFIINPHITATAIFALNSCLRVNFLEKVETAINLGAQYLKGHLQASIGKSAIESELKEFKERVIISGSHNARGDYAVKNFEHPYYMVLPALLMTGHLGFHENNILTLYRKTTDALKNFKPLGGLYYYFELSDIANALILFFSTANVTRNSDLIFSSSGFCPSCKRGGFLTLLRNSFSKLRLRINNWLSPLKKNHWKWIFIISLIFFDIDVGFLIYVNNPDFFGGKFDVRVTMALYGIVSITIFLPIKKICKKYKEWE